LLGALVFGLLAALVFPRLRATAVAAGAAGVLTHIFWDALNFWGVQLLWPRRVQYSANLMHEGDRLALAIVAVAALLLWRGQRRAAVVALAVLIPAYLGLQAAWRSHARRLESTELAARRIGVYPSAELACGWQVLSAGPGDMTIHCVPSPFSRTLRPALAVALREDSRTQASQAAASVQEFLAHCPFPFTEELPGRDGGKVVIWRDLREVYQQRNSAVPPGIHIEVDPSGRIVNERHHWWLSLW
jgi:hypothetical protein